MNGIRFLVVGGGFGGWVGGGVSGGGVGAAASRPPVEADGDNRRGKGPRRHQGHRHYRRRRRGVGDDHGRYRLPEGPRNVGHRRHGDQFQGRRRDGRRGRYLGAGRPPGQELRDCNHQLRPAASAGPAAHIEAAGEHRRAAGARRDGGHGLDGRAAGGDGGDRRRRGLSSG